METPAVILTDTGELQLTSITRHCLLHTVEVLRPHINLSIVLPQSGSHKIDGFCEELQNSINTKQSRKKSATIHLPNDPLVPSIETHRFCEGAIDSLDFMLVIEKQFLTLSKGNINLETFHRCCWKYYEMERKSEISFPKWFSRECTYRLWLIYNCVLEPDLHNALSQKTTNEVMKRIVEYCGYKWNPMYACEIASEINFPSYLSTITTYFEQFKLETSLTCEVIGDMVEEIVNGVLKMGRLTKKGHKRKNWKNRWFVLQRTVLRYYESRDNMTIKGQLVLNGNTEVKSMPDKGKRRFCFHVTCGHTGIPFEIAADDQRTKHEWMLAIKKAIALAKVLDGSSKASDFAESLQGFYLLKYGTSQPSLSRQDSTVRKMKYHATLKTQRQRLSGKKVGAPVNDDKFDDSLETEDDSDQYIPMSPAGQGDITSDDSESGDEDQYLPMDPLTEEELAGNYDAVTIHVTQSLPVHTIGESNSTQINSSGTFSGRVKSTQYKPPIPEKDVSQDLTYDPVSFEGKGNQTHVYDPVDYDDKEDKKNGSPSLLSSRSPLSPVIDDEKEGSYIHLVSSRPSKPSDLETSNGYDEPKNWTAQVGSSTSSSDLYLKLIHDGPKSPTDTNTLSPTQDCPPAVPAHRKSPSPVHKSRSSASEGSSDQPPPPPPRSSYINVQYNSSPNLPRVPPPPIPSRRLSSETSPGSTPKHNAPPPLPSKDTSSPMTSPVRTSALDQYNTRRATYMPSNKNKIVEELQIRSNRSNSDEGDTSSRNSQHYVSIVPAVPPR